MKSSSRRRVGIGLAGPMAALIIVVGAVAGGFVDQTNATLVVMGFDPDRAQLITALLIGLGSAGGAVIVSGRRFEGTALGVLGSVALFGPTFLAETNSSIGASGADGVFSPEGWARTLVTLAIVFTACGWIGATIAEAARPTLLRAATNVRDFLRGALREERFDWRLGKLPALVGLLAVLVLVSAPVFSDLVNYSPDSRMRHGAPPKQALVPNDSTAQSQDTVPPSASARSSASRQTSAVPTASTSVEPWLTWKPRGAGTIETFDLPAPWVGGTSTREPLAAYLPAGYADSTRRYPVLYVTGSFGDWNAAINMQTALDTLMSSGAIPASIVAFVDLRGGPYADSECADSYDGRVWLDTFIGTTFVQTIDARYRTIPTVEARAVVGFSQGGYCAAILALHHPTTFGTAISISGYFTAGKGDATSGLPFANNPAALANASPMQVAPKLTADQRAHLYFVLVYPPGERVYGAQSTSFQRLLASNGYGSLAIPTTDPHGWVQVRHVLPNALEAWAARMVSTEVFASGP